MCSTKGNCVRFAEELRTPSPPPAAAAPATLEVKLGFLPQGGIYLADLLQLQAGPAAAASPVGTDAAGAPPAAAQAAAAGAPGAPCGAAEQLPQPQVLGLQASNLSVAVEGAPGSPHARLVCRLWADREGPFDESFRLVLPPHGQEVAVRVTATVLSRKKGKPALRSNVRCVGWAADTDTEAASDWQGFE